MFQLYLVCLNLLDNTWKFKSSTGMPSNRMPSTRIAAERWMRSEYNGPEPHIRKLIGSPSSDRTKLSTLELVLSLLYYFPIPNYQCLCLNFLCETIYHSHYCHRRYFLTLVNQTILTALQFYTFSFTILPKLLLYWALSHFVVVTLSDHLQLVKLLSSANFVCSLRMKFVLCYWHSFCVVDLSRVLQFLSWE